MEFKLFEHPKGHKLREFLNSRHISAAQGIPLNAEQQQSGE